MSNTDYRVRLNKFPPVGGTSTQYIKGNGEVAVLNTDTVVEGTNQYLTYPRVRAVTLTGMSIPTTPTSITVLDTVMGSLGKLQSQVNSRQVYSYITTAPNVTVSVNAITATGTEANIDLVTSPKGTGALLTQVPDNLVAGGNKRGIGSVDLQMSRTVNSQVGSGNYSVLSGGQGNTASGNQSVIGGGVTNTASGLQSTVVGGSTNTASGAYSVVLGGANNQAVNQFASSLGYGTNGRLQGCFAHNGSGAFVSVGDCQTLSVSLRGTTANATITPMYIDGATTGNTINRLVMKLNTTWYISGRVVARSATGSSKVFSIKETSATCGATLANIVLGTNTVLGQDAVMGTTGTPATWAVSLGVDTTNGAVVINVTGDSATTVVRWYAYLHITEVSF